MAWFRVDDTLFSHPKWLAVSLRARGLWVSAGSWSAATGTDGHVPKSALGMFGAKPTEVAELVKPPRGFTTGLWEKTEDGWLFHDWDLYQPDAASVKAGRSEARQKMSASGQHGNHLRWHAARGLRVPDCEFCIITADSPPDELDIGYPDTPESGTRSGTRSGQDQV